METGGQATGGEGGGNEQPNVFAEVFAGDENAGGGGDGGGAAAGSKGDQAGSGAGGQRGDAGAGAAAGGASGGTGDGKGGEGQGAAQGGEGQGTQGGQQQGQGAAQGGQQQGGQQQQTKQYTQEELDKYFKVWKPDVKFIERILGDDKEDALKAVLDMRDGLAEQFETLQSMQRNLLKQELMKELAPALKFAKENAATKEKEVFYQEHADLKDHDELVQIVYKAMLQEGFRAPNITEARKALAERVRKLVPAGTGGGTGGSGSGSSAGQSSGGSQQNNGQQTGGKGGNNGDGGTQGAGKRPAQLNSGSQTGGGGDGSGSAGTNVFQEIFG
jgi:hypothetical protein